MAEHNDPDRPNILWICTDQQHYDTIQALGNDYIQTPNLDRLVREGVSFTHAHCQSPSCTASRARFLTGLYANTVHCPRNGNDYFPANESVIHFIPGIQMIMFKAYFGKLIQPKKVL